MISGLAETLSLSSFFSIFFFLTKSVKASTGMILVEPGAGWQRGIESAKEQKELLAPPHPPL